MDTPWGELLVMSWGVSLNLPLQLFIFSKHLTASQPARHWYAGEDWMSGQMITKILTRWVHSVVKNSCLRRVLKQKVLRSSFKGWGWWCSTFCYYNETTKTKQWVSSSINTFQLFQPVCGSQSQGPRLFVFYWRCKSLKPGFIHKPF